MANITLDTSVRYLPKVGEKRAKMLEKLGLFRIYDLLTFFPRRYEDWSECVPLFKLQDDKEQSFIATVAGTPRIHRTRGRSTIFAVLSDGSCSIRAVWFNQPYLLDKLQSGEEYFFHGKVTRDGFQFQVSYPADLSAYGGAEAGPYPRYRRSSTGSRTSASFRGSAVFFAAGTETVCDPLCV